MTITAPTTKVHRPFRFGTLARDDVRRKAWLELFGTTMLPLFGGEPRIFCMNEQSVLVYCVNLTRLAPEHYRCFRHHCVDEDYSEATVANWISHGFPVVAEGVVLVESEKNLADAATNDGRI